MDMRTDLKSWLLISIFLLGLGYGNCAGKIIHVCADGVDVGSINTASDTIIVCPTIQAAIDDCNDGDVVIVAPGTYTGDGNRDIDFKGKVITVQSIDPNDPNIVAATVIDCNGTEDNSHRGFYFHSGEDSNSILAGFTIINGYALNKDFAPQGFESNGGAIFCRYSGPMISNCVFSGNSAEEGGGIYNYGGEPTLINCIFSENSATDGGGVFDSGSYRSLTLTDCLFIKNVAQNNGGGACSRASTTTLTNCVLTDNLAEYGGGISTNGRAVLTNCIFNENSAEYGGGIDVWNGQATLTNCTFNGNSAAQGGGMDNWDGKSTLINCTFFGNLADRGGGIYNWWSGGRYPDDLILVNCIFDRNLSEYGGGICNYNGSFTLTGCIFSGNSASRGGGIYDEYDWFGSIVTNCTFAGNLATNGNALACNSWRYRFPSKLILSGCLFWDGANAIWNNDGSRIAISYSDVLGGQEGAYDPLKEIAWGTGNVDVDPCFADPNNGDYHLKSQAGRWDPNEQNWVKDDVTSPCIDAGDPMSPIGYEPFPNGGRINMGAYGGTAEASKSYFGEPLCETIVAGDINGDCKVDFADFEIMALHWLESRNNTQPPGPR